MPCVFRSSQFRTWILNCCTLVRAIFEYLYIQTPLPWGSIFAAHRLALFLSGDCLMSSTHSRFASIRAISSALPNSLWPPCPSHLDAANIINLVWSPWYRHYYIGKTVNFKERLRRHIHGFLNPHSSPQQPYQMYLIAKAGGLSHRAVSSCFFMPIIQCSNADDLLGIEGYLIRTLQPRLNEPYIRKLLSPLI